MSKVAWATDIHLDWATPQQRDRFYASFGATGADAALISGDIGEGKNTAHWLREMAGVFRQPIYFVLGNHDFYGGSIPQVRRDIRQLAASGPGLVYLPAAGVVELGPETGLIGHDGWGDARLGDYEGSQVFLSDFVTIKELAAVNHDRALLHARLRSLGDEAAAHVARVLPEALARYRQVVFLTHVPPFREAAWHEGQYSADDWLPYFSCRAVGETLLEIMRQHPARQLLVLCGHTHGSGESQIRENLRVLTGGADDRGPRFHQTLQLD